MRRRARRGGGRQVELVIEGLGAGGDGFAKLDGRPVFVPFTVAGDRVRARLTGERGGGYKAEMLELLDEGSGRVRCVACGHRCLIPPGRPGICKVRFNRDGVLHGPVAM